MNKITNSREVVLKILVDIDKKGAYTNIILKNYLDKSDFKPVDKKLITELVHGVVKNKLRIDYILSQFSKIRIGKMSKWVHNILRLGIYQMLFLDKIPDFASVNECVKLTKKYSHTGSVSFVNGILRNISRNKGKIKYPVEAEEPAKYLSIMYSYPMELISEWILQYGYESTKRICIVNDMTPEICIRINTLITNEEDLINELSSENLNVKSGKYDSNSLYISNTGNMEELKAYNKGLFHVIGESSTLVTKILDPKPNEIIIDACAAPGGKTINISQLMENKGKIFAFDIHPHKIDLINRNAKRLGIKNIETKIHDSTSELIKMIGIADKVLVDVPCSGLGIIRKKPDIKWNDFSKTTMDILSALQKTILNISSKYVKLGGKLVYSTCTLRKQENIDIVKDFLEKNKKFELDDISEYIPDNLEVEKSKGWVQLFPSEDGLEGFFICKMRHKE